MKYLNSNEPFWLKNMHSMPMQKSVADYCDNCGNQLQHNDMCKMCDGGRKKKKKITKKSYGERKSGWIEKALNLEGQVGEYPYDGSPVATSIEELSGKTLKQLAILPRNEGETEVILRALEIMGLEDAAKSQLEEVYAGRFGKGQV